ncbi:MAG: protein phosphatase CheZ [Desulfobulbaceae bacterium]|nr:protein phosphatase CheZ [Desulfobulbaceae bacterium]
MADNKPEVNLEIGSGFFRITALDAIYNITVLGNYESSASKVVERIVEVEKQGELPPLEVGGDDYYKKVSSDLYHDIGNLAKSLSSTMTRIPMEDQRQKRASLDEAGEKIEDAKAQLKDIVSMTESATMEIMDSVESIQSQTDNVKDLLSFLKDHAAFAAEEEAAAAGDDSAEDGGDKTSVAELQKMMGQALDLIVGLQADGDAAAPAADAPAAAAAEPVKRYAFVIDVIFQTIYELCTNETVKDHITNAREKAATLFDNEIFLTQMNEKVSALEPDGDNFFTIPLADVLKALHDACSDSKIQNLFKKMVSGQADIFLDGSLPIEAPPMEEVAGAEPEEAAAPEPAPPSGSDPRLGELAGIIEQCLAATDTLGGGAAVSANGHSAMTKADQMEIFSKIEAAFGIATNICGNVSKITEALSFQDLSGQQILKIIKLLGDFQVQLLAIVVSFGSQLKRKEEKPEITAEESKRLAQEDVDSYINKINAPVGEEDEGGVLDQDAVNKMLEDMGF